MSLAQEAFTEMHPETYEPLIETSVFEDRPSAKYWIGVVATPDVVDLPDEYLATRRLRASVYIDKYGFLSDDVRQPDGGETDEHDQHSTHFAVLENTGEGQAYTVGSIRLIHKENTDRLLPVEKYYPENFTDEQASVGEGEASRFIASHHDKIIQGAISVGIMRAIILHSQDQDKDFYAVVEKPLMKRFDAVGLPYTQLAKEPKPLEDYDYTLNYPLLFEPNKIASVVYEDEQEERLITKFFKSAESDRGIGYYESANLMTQQGEK